MQKNQDSIIVGWGLAGVVLAWQLYFSNKKFKVFDNEDQNSSKVAAGIVNPIVFKRMTKSWRSNELLPYSFDFYTKIQDLTGKEFLQPKSIYKIINSLEEENNWSVKMGDDNFEEQISFVDKNEIIPHINAPYGFGKVKTYGNIDTELFISSSKEFFKKKEIEFFNEKFEYDKINLEEKSYRNFIYFSEIFFCEGVGIKENPFFNYIPFKPTHGEILTIESDDLKIKNIINKNIFILPIKDNIFKVGATYNWELEENITTESGKNELIEQLNNFSDFTYKIIAHQAGIRPTVSDRRPVLGSHHQHSFLYIFNGLGTKGVMIAPFVSELLLNHVYLKKEIEKEIHVNRFYKKHFKNV